MNKKNYLLLGLLFLASLGIQSCGGDEGVKDGGKDSIETVKPGLKGEMDELTATEQKDFLQEAGIEFVNEINAETHDNLIDVIDFLAAEYANYEVDDDYVDKLAALYKESGYDEDDYYGAARKCNPVLAVRDLMAISLNTAKRGAKLAENAERIYESTLKAGLKDLYGGFTPNENYEIWAYDKSVTDRLEVKFTDNHNQKWVATLKGSKETTRIHVTVYDKNVEKTEYEGGPEDGSSFSDTRIYDDEYTIDVPTEITFAVKCDGKTVIDMTVNSSLAFDWAYNEESEWISNYEWYESEWSADGGYYNWADSEDKYSYSIDIDYSNLSVDAKLNVNGYEETFKSKVTKSGISTSASVKINGKSMLKAEASLEADVDDFVGQANENIDEEEIDASAVKAFSMYVDLLGKVQIVGKCDKFEDLHDALVDLEEAEDDEDFEKFKRNLQQVNEAYDITLHYNNKETVQANIEFEAYEEREEYWDYVYVYFYVNPVIVFTGDDSRYNFEDYFTERNFEGLLDVVGDLLGDIEDLVD